MEDIKKLANQFRIAIEKANKANDLSVCFWFDNFPEGCCSDAADMLAEFLKSYKIKTYRVFGEYYGEIYQSHAWLQTEDGIIIDITGDQFKDNSVFLNYDIPVYVGLGDDFHNLFEVDVDRVEIAKGTSDVPHLIELYPKIKKYL